MPEFQGSQFLPLMQQKWKQDEENRLAPFTGLGAGLQSGMVSGVDTNTARKKSQYEMAQELIKERLKNVELIHLNDKTPLSINEETAVYHQIASGQGLPQGIGTQAKETSYSRLQTTTIVPDENMVKLGKEYGLVWEIGKPVEVSMKQLQDISKSALLGKRIEGTKDITNLKAGISFSMLDRKYQEKFNDIYSAKYKQLEDTGKYTEEEAIKQSVDWANTQIGTNFGTEEIKKQTWWQEKWGQEGTKPSGVRITKPVINSSTLTGGTTSQVKSKYEINKVYTEKGKKFKVVGFYADGEPDVIPAK